MQYELIAPRDESMSAVEQVLFNRGIKFEDIKHFRYPSEADLIDPLQLDNMREGAQMLMRHIQQNDKIFVQVDKQHCPR